MNIALIGYGRMGHEIETMALERGHKITLKIEVDNLRDLVPENFREIDVVIEFTSPESAFGNVMKCLGMQKPVVSGTTGWQNDYGRAAEMCIRSGTSFIHSSNFSVGVNILFTLNSYLGKIMEHHKEYSPLIEEIHHIRKIDAPSGTAISLAESIIAQHSELEGWCFENNMTKNCLPVRSIREGTVPGTHTVEWNSEIDAISLKHVAKNRKGFALGAVLAAEFISGRKGVFTMKEVLGF